MLSVKKCAIICMYVWTIHIEYAPDVGYSSGIRLGCKDYILRLFYRSHVCSTNTLFAAGVIPLLRASVSKM